LKDSTPLFPKEKVLVDQENNSNRTVRNLHFLFILLQGFSWHNKSFIAQNMIIDS